VVTAGLARGPAVTLTAYAGFEEPDYKGKGLWQSGGGCKMRGTTGLDEMCQVSIS
jgi:hypothetical protein